jgi:putative ABC transport system permease protein
MCLAAAVLGALNAVRRAAALPPAEAMRPEPPADYSVSWIERAGMRRFLTQPTRMILRNLQRHPGRSAVSLIGIASGAALLILGSFSLDAINEMMDLQFSVAQRYDVMVSFVEPTSARAWQEVRRLPGVLAAEPFRSIPVRLRHGPRSRQTSISGIPAEPSLNRLVDASYVAITPPPDGLAMSKVLAEILGVTAGDSITVEVLEGQRPVRQVRVARLVDDFMGTGAWMQLDALHRLMREGRTLSGAYLLVDESRVDRLYHELKNTPRVAGVMLKSAAIESFDETLSEMVGTIRVVNTLFAVVIAFGVVYNSARISLAERGRELATLRVIGFTRTEISYILLGELIVLTLLAIPLGMLLGHGLAGVMVQAMNNEVWRIPLTVSPRTHAFAAITVAMATVLSSVIVRRRLNNLDLVEVLKTRE